MNSTNNNRAKTALECFLNGVQSFGCPLRVRIDKGVENWENARCMVTGRGVGQGSVIA
eukprot:gene8329-9223_t